MKICLLSDKYPPDPGGLASSTRRLASGLAMAGHTVHVVVPSQALLPGQICQTCENNVQVHRLGMHHRTDDTRADWFDLVTRLCTTINVDILHGYYLVGAGFVAAYAGRYLHIPSVVSARGNDIDRAIFNPNHAGPILWALSQASAVTAVSRDLARKIRALDAGNQPQVIPNGVDASHFAPAPPSAALYAELGLPHAPPIIGFVGEARLKKGLTILLPAFALVADKVIASTNRPPTLLLIGGVRQDDADILRVFEAQHPELTVQVIPYSSQDRLPDLYNLLDVLVLPSLRDGLPNTLLEGMACECAVVAADVGGIPDVVDSNKSGLLIPPANVKALAQAVLELLQNPAQRADLGRAARRTIICDFSPEQELSKNLELYQQLTA